MTYQETSGIITLVPSPLTTADARVVELVDSLASGASALYGRAGSTPASRTKDNPDLFPRRKVRIIVLFLLRMKLDKSENRQDNVYIPIRDGRR